MHRTVLQYLDNIFEAIRTIEGDTNGISFDEFVADRRRKDAVIRTIEIIGEATKKMSGYPLGSPLYETSGYTIDNPVIGSG